MHRYSAKSKLTFTAILLLAFTASLQQAAAQTDADPIVRIRGIVKDEQGQPVSDVLVERLRFGSTHTDASGKFELRLPPGNTGMFTSPPQERMPVYEIEIKPHSSTGLLATSSFVAINAKNQLMIRPDEFVDSLEISLTKGIRVIGKVEDTAGQPIKDVTVEELSVGYPIRKAGEPEPPKRPPQQRPLPRTVTGGDGTFELLLTPDVHTLHFSCRSPGVDLPETTHRSINAQQEQKKLPHIVVDVQNGQPIALKPVRVERVPPVEVTVLLPDGQLAAGAEVVVWEHREEQRIEVLGDPNNKEISSHVFTDNQGKAQLLSVGKPSVRATIKATLTRDGVALEGESLIASGLGKRTVVQLSPYRQGIQIIPK